MTEPVSILRKKKKTEIIIPKIAHERREDTIQANAGYNLLFENELE